MTDTPPSAAEQYDDAHRSLVASRAASARNDILLEDAAVALETVRTIHRENHFTNKFRAIIQGAR